MHTESNLTIITDELILLANSKVAASAKSISFEYYPTIKKKKKANKDTKKEKNKPPLQKFSLENLYKNHPYKTMKPLCTKIKVDTTTSNTLPI